MAHIDITIDFETCGLGVNAAPMQLAAIVWDRSSTDDPFACASKFNMGIDLRSCFMLGMEFDADTSQWWAKQSEEVKNSVSSIEAYPIHDVMALFVDWVRDQTKDSDSFSIWAQGSDFDIAKINEYLRKCDLKPSWWHTQARCARTYILENGLIAYFKDADEKVKTAAMSNQGMIYKKIPPMPDTICNSASHDAIYDCYKTSWNVWQIMRIINSL